MPWTLIRSMLREIVTSLCLAVIGLTCVFVVVLLMQMVGRFDVISTGTMISFIPGFALGYQTLLLPIATLAALSLGYSRLNAAGEKTALFASAVTPRAVITPAILIGCIVMIPASYASFKLAPEAYRDRVRIKSDALADALKHPPSGTQEFAFPNFTLAYSDFREGVFHDLVMIRDDGNGRDLILCKQARIAYDDVQSEISIYNGEPTVNMRLTPEGMPDRFLAKMNIIKVTQPLATYNSDNSLGPKGQSASYLFHTIESLTPQGKRHHLKELSRRIASTLSPLFFALIGALIALALPSKNKIVPLFAGLLAAAGTYFGGISAAKPFVESTAYAPIVGVGIAQAVIFGPMLIVIALLWWKVRRG